MTKFNPQIKLTLHKEFISYLSNQPICPINIEISPCGVCNADCAWCFYRNKQTGNILQTEILLRFINEAKELGTKAITWTGGGEPTLHPDFKAIVKNVNITQGLITNGLIIPSYDPSVFSWIRVSKTDTDWNKESLKILRACNKVGLCINYTGNEEELKKSLDLVYDLNLSYLQVRPALNIDGNLTEIKVPEIIDPKLELTEYKFSEANKLREYTSCEGYHFVPFLWEDGNLDTCAYKRFTNGYNIGNIYITPFKELLKLFPKEVLADKTCQICCKNHEINSLIYKAKKIENKDFV
jgi:organic radical activating enzyme